MGFFAKMLSKLAGKSASVEPVDAPAARAVPMLEMPAERVTSRLVDAPVQPNPSVASQEPGTPDAINAPSTSTKVAVSEIAVEVNARLLEYSFIHEAELPPLPDAKQWGGVHSIKIGTGNAVENVHQLLEPFMGPELAKLLELKDVQVVSLTEAPRIAIALRALIRTRKKAELPFDNLLHALFGVCVMRDFARSLMAEGSLKINAVPATMCQYVAVDELRAVACGYATIGYQHVASLAKTDVKWLISALGEPAEHKTIEGVFQTARRSAIARQCWAELHRLSAENKAGQDPCPQMREWLTEKIKVAIGEREAVKACLAKSAALASLLMEPFIVLDLETTGLNPETDEILELVAVLTDPAGRVTSEFSALVKVKHGVPTYVTCLKGVSGDSLGRDGRSLADALTAFHSFVGSRPIFVHSSLLHGRFIEKAAAQVGLTVSNPVHDTLFMPCVYVRPGVPSEDPHLALTVARAALEALVLSRSQARKQQGSPVSSPSKSARLHWSPTGLFPLAVAGTSNYRSAISELAQNPAGHSALVFGTASLVPEDNNPHDSNAVMVVIEGKKVGYLSREYAADFRGYFDAFGVPVQETTCDAVISNGLVAYGNEYSYTVELDISPSPERPSTVSPSYKGLARFDPSPVFSRQKNGSYFVQVRLGPDAFEDLDARLSPDTWTTPHWTDINYYLPNKFGVGLGHKLFGIPKDRHKQMFGVRAASVTIEAVKGRVILLAMTPMS